MARFSASTDKSPHVALRKARKTMAELVNEQLDPSARAEHTHPLEGDAEGIAESYEWGDDDGDNDGPSARDHVSKVRRQTSSQKRPRSSGGLRHRGPLDASLSEGKYAATPFNVEDAMDDIFGTLDMADLDVEGEELFGNGKDDEFQGFAADVDGDASYEDNVEEKTSTKRPKAARTTRNLSEEEYAEYLDKKREVRRAARKLSGVTSSGMSAMPEPMDSEEKLILDQLESLRQSHLSLLHKNSQGEAEAADQAKSRSRTQEAVRHYVMLYSQLLRMRVKLQSAVTTAVRLPQFYAYSMFTEGAEKEGGKDDGASDARASYAKVCRELTEILSSIYTFAVKADVDAGDATAPSKKKRRAEAGEIPDFRQLQRFHQRMLGRANDCLAYWGTKLVQANSAKLQSIAQPLPQQIAAILAAKSRLLHKVQKNRGHVFILAHPDHERCATSAEAKAKRAAQMAYGDVDSEIYDDADFLRELVRRGGAVANRLEQQLADMNRELMPTKEASKKGFHRMTKGKAVSYDPRPKIVGFLMPQGYANSGRNDVVFHSIFK